MAGNRDGFKNGNPGGSDNGDGTHNGSADHIKGTNGADTLYGAAGDDVIIGYRGDDTLTGGTGHDDLSGNKGADSLIGGDWVDSDSDGIEIGNWVRTAGSETTEDTSDDVYTFYREFTQDNSVDHYVAADSFANNGTDTIYGYDEALDAIQVNALQSAYNTLFLVDGEVTAQDLIDGGYISYDDTTGELQIDLDGGGDNYETWFVVKADYSEAVDGATNPVSPGASADWSYSDTVTVEIGDQSFSFT